MTELTIYRIGQLEFRVRSGENIYHVTRSPRWSCTCPARGVCKHLRTVISSLGMAVGDEIRVAPVTDTNGDDGLLDGEEFDAEAGRDVRAELDYIRSGREKRNFGC